MDTTLNLDISWNSDEFVVRSQEPSQVQDNFTSKINEAQNMLDSLRLNYVKCTEKNKILQKSNTIITKENQRLKQRINDIQKNFDLVNKSKLQSNHKPTNQSSVDFQGLSLSSIAFDKSTSDGNSLKKTCCCSKDPTQSDKSSSHKGCYFYKYRDPSEESRKVRPRDWCLPTPKKKLFNDIALGSVTLFKF
ncbi:hypothetical protein SteCoe_22889 [Stentor coeruleus]|uniref:Uncharacterized protein n=1 Tax=Stentor coeruleus TaxID=5963 RepID=A0A1R2BLR9_9CILI|nr:hypothetical protein SteCoe_22889 [Stentor coeruleus]